MILQIDTTEGDEVCVALVDGEKVIAEKTFSAPRAQAEKLLPAIEKIIKAQGLELSQLMKIQVANSGGKFTALRIGVVTANALAYALGVPVEGRDKKVKKSGKLQVVVPQYDREPNITLKKTDSNHHI